MDIYFNTTLISDCSQPLHEKIFDKKNEIKHLVYTACYHKFSSKKVDVIYRFSFGVGVADSLDSSFIIIEIFENIPYIIMPCCAPQNGKLSTSS